MSHPETSPYAGVMLMGKSEVVEGKDVPTACTDGVNKYYGLKFMLGLTQMEITGIVLHENLHVLGMHILRMYDEFKTHPKLANAACDYVVNAIILNLNDKSLCSLPEGRLYDERFINWSVREVYNYLKSGNPPPTKGKGGKPCPSGKPEDVEGGVSIGGEVFKTDTLDKHDHEAAGEPTEEKMKEQGREIEKAIRQGRLLAGKLGGGMPLSITADLAHKVSWKQYVPQWLMSHLGGRGDASWRRYNRRYLADNMYTPTSNDTRVRELLIAIDTSGSTTGSVLAEFLGTVADVCSTCMPEKVRVLWWDTKVHAEQVFTEEYDDIKSLLRPRGGGGTKVSCVSSYVESNSIKPDCAIILTDGWVEDDIKWGIKDTPTLWLVASNTSFKCPGNGVVVEIE